MHCPHCGHGTARTAMPTIDGRAVLMCLNCKRVAAQKDWRESQKEGA